MVYNVNVCTEHKVTCNSSRVPHCTDAVLERSQDISLYAAKTQDRLSHPNPPRSISERANSHAITYWSNRADIARASNELLRM